MMENSEARILSEITHLQKYLFSYFPIDLVFFLFLIFFYFFVKIFSRRYFAHRKKNLTIFLFLNRILFGLSLLIFSFIRIKDLFLEIPLTIISLLFFIAIYLIPYFFRQGKFASMLGAFGNRDYQVGDFIKINDFSGRIRKINSKFIQLFLQDGNYANIPIDYFLKYPVTIIKSKNFFIYEERIKVPEKKLIDKKLIQDIKMKVLHLPYDIDAKSFQLSFSQGELYLKIKFWPHFIEDNVRNNVSLIINESIRVTELD